jgi:hypothetical protein
VVGEWRCLEFTTFLHSLNGPVFGSFEYLYLFNFFYFAAHSFLNV